MLFRSRECTGIITIGIRANPPPEKKFSTLAGRFPSIILTHHAKSVAMEEQTKLHTDLTEAISSMNAKLDEIHPVVLDLHS